jgi:formylglycine-generating enzyme required for sulfatase activity
MKLAYAAALVAPLFAVACSGQGGDPVKDPSSGSGAPTGASAATGAATNTGTSAASATSAPANAAADTATAATTPEPAAKTAAAPACPEGMALVPGGTFKMELRKDPVTVGSLCMDANEVTADQYTACVKAGKCTADHLNCAAQATYEAADKGNHPIVCVDFNQAVSYCTAQNKRLPSDEEWEWAARGGAEGWAFPWGNNSPKEQLCWSGVRTRNGTCAVGSTPAGDNPQGIHDLKTKVRVGRGGSWKDGIPDLMRSSRPGGFEVTYRCGFLGIRCVIPAPGSASETAAPAASK